jgi:Chaperone for flagella basal body P-ring formation
MRVLPLAILCFLAGAGTPSAHALAVEAGGIPAAPAESRRPAAKMLADAAIEETVLAALADRRVDVGGGSLELSGVSARSAIAADAELAVERLTYQPAGRRFTAVLTAVSRGAPLQRFTVAGRLRQQIEVPVLNRRLQAGEVITPADLQWVAVGDRGLPGNAVYDPQELIGHTPRRSLPAGATLVAADLKRPTVVAKGALVADPEHSEHAADGARQGARRRRRRRHHPRRQRAEPDGRGRRRARQWAGCGR